MTSNVVSALLAVVMTTGCSREGARSRSADPENRDSAPTVSNSGTGSGNPNDWFVDRAAESNLQFVYFNGMSGEFYFPEMLPGGVAVFDYDNDGDLDIYFAQGQMLGEGKTPTQGRFPPSGAAPLKGRLYKNDLNVNPDGTRTLHFTDVTEQSGIDARGYGMGVAAGDFDNNGCLDLYLTFVGSNRLFRNNCDGTFTDVSKPSGTDDSGWSVSASFLDYDRDGWLDLYVGHYVQYDIKADQPCTGLTGSRDYCTPAVYTPQADRLYRNQGNGTFVDVTARALAGGPFGPALGVVSGDFNNDGWMDIYVANDGKENLLWMNQGNGTLKNMGLLSGSALSGDGKPEGSMGVDAGDFDNDGDEDLYMTHLPAEGNNLYVNDGKALFEDLSASSALGPMSLGHTGFGTAWFDYDNDGWLDILAVNGAIEAAKNRAGQPFPYDERKLLFRNLRNGRFEDVTAQAGAVFKLSEVSRGAAFGDIDNDGDMDVVVSNLNGPARLLVNTIGNRSHWLGLKLVGASPATRSERTEPAVPQARDNGERRRTVEGRDMVGARLEIIRKGQPTLWRRARGDGSYASANDPRVLAGLGDSTDMPTIRVRWPGGGVEEFSGVAIDQWTTLKEGGGRRP
jgi:enediyne biosynthesis protein E4